VNDVLLALCGGALREYLLGKDELPDASLIVMAPINTRTVDEASVVGNVLATMNVPVHTDVADPMSRLRAVSEATANAKATDSAIGARQMTDISRHIPSGTLALAGRLVTGLGLGHRTRFANCTVTNVPGPQQPLYLNGAKLLMSTGCGPVLDGMGLILTAISYDGEIALSLTSCREIVPDPEHLVACMKRAFQNLKKAASDESKKSKPRVTKKKSGKKARPV
jgi:WS/DGAT/MGAT family acyltransferase